MSVERKTAIVTGTSRDVGEYVTYALAKDGWNILGLYKNSHHREDQNRIIEEIIKDYNVRMVARRINLTNRRTPNVVAGRLDKHFGGKADALILNAAGGYGKSLEEAWAINVDSQVRLVDGLLNKLAEGSVIVYNTSDPSHRFKILRESVEGGKYEPVAQTKFEIEEILRSRIPELEDRGIRVAVVVGNMLEGTFVSRVLGKRERALVSRWRTLTENGNFPTREDMAAADLDVISGNYPSGYTKYVGIKPEHQLYPSSSFLKL